MNMNAARTLAASFFVASILLAGCAEAPPHPYIPPVAEASPALTVRQGRDKFVEAWKEYVAVGGGYTLEGYGSILRPIFHDDGLTMVGTGKPPAFRAWIPAENARQFMISQCALSWDADNKRITLLTKTYCPGTSVEERLADGLASWSSAIQAAQAAHGGFDAAAQSYRAAAVKPELPEEARAFKVQADVAVREKRFADATDLYYEGLLIAPWWPEGRYNRALILAETQDYALAGQEMKRYLTLVPDAANAREAQDRIYEWDGKAKAVAAEQPVVDRLTGDDLKRAKKRAAKEHRLGAY